MSTRRPRESDIVTVALILLTIIAVLVAVIGTLVGEGWLFSGDQESTGGGPGEAIQADYQQWQGEVSQQVATNLARLPETATAADRARAELEATAEVMRRQLAETQDQHSGRDDIPISDDILISVVAGAAAYALWTGIIRLPLTPKKERTIRLAFINLLVITVAVTIFHFVPGATDAVQRMPY